jgi:hypothetical protein
VTSFRRLRARLRYRRFDEDLRRELERRTPWRGERANLAFAPRLAHDGVTYAAAALLIAGTAALASHVPARRALRIDPAETLRAET